MRQTMISHINIFYYITLQSVYSFFKMRYVTTLVIVVLHLFTNAQPVITSFSPLSGNAGTNVTINGTGFSAVVNENIVFFGAVRALVISASPTSLIVTTPASASYE